MPSPAKKTKVSQLSNQLQKAANLILFNFGPASHQKLEALRRQLKQAEKARLQIVKNSLLQVAAAKTKIKELTEKTILTGPSALLTLTGNWSKTMTALYQFIKETGAEFKIGRLDGTWYGQADLARLAQLPAKEILIGKIAGALKSPHQRMIYSMRFGMIKLLYVMKQMNRKG